MLIGLKPVVSKAAYEQLEVLKKILKEIENQSDFEDLSKGIVEKIQVLLGDRASTQSKFYQLFEKYRTNIIQMSEKWPEMSEDQKQELLEMTTVNCQIHVMSNLTIHVITGLMEHEKDELKENNIKEPQVLILLRHMSSLIR
jgi:hypothetical protein